MRFLAGVGLVKGQVSTLMDDKSFIFFTISRRDWKWGAASLSADNVGMWAGTTVVLLNAMYGTERKARSTPSWVAVVGWISEAHPPIAWIAATVCTGFGGWRPPASSALRFAFLETKKNPLTSVNGFLSY